MNLQLNIVAKLSYTGCFIVIKKPAFLKQKGTPIFFLWNPERQNGKISEASCSNLLQVIIESQ